jgi:nucleoside-diphosphate-sugar epimerase
VTAVAGDLAQARLGLSEVRFRELARSVDAIYHAGATVHYLRTYRALRASNVLGTEEVLRLAASERPKPLHHISSLAVFGRTDHTVCEDTPLDRGCNLSDGYSQSKWVAEQLVVQARQVGIPVAIYRPGRLTGHSQTGASNANDLLDNLVRRACAWRGSEARPAGGHGPRRFRERGAGQPGQPSRIAGPNVSSRSPAADHVADRDRAGVLRIPLRRLPYESWTALSASTRRIAGWRRRCCPWAG